MIEKLLSYEPNVVLCDRNRIEIYYSYSNFSEFMTAKIYERICIPEDKYIITVKKEEEWDYGTSYNVVVFNNKDEIEKYKKLLKEKLQENISKNKDKIEKILLNRQKELDKQKEKREQAQVEKDKMLNKTSDYLESNGYICSKVYSSNHHGVYVSDRINKNKFHKYIKNDSNNIKFATIEVKILKEDIKIGVKLETKGEIGCSFEEFEMLYNKIKIEVENLKGGM